VCVCACVRVCVCVCVCVRERERERERERLHVYVCGRRDVVVGTCLCVGRLVHNCKITQDPRGVAALSGTLP